MNNLVNVITLDSREVAMMIDKNHAHLLREIETYSSYFSESKIGLAEFFQESTYLDSQKKPRKNYQITRKGCEFIAHKLTGRKGAVFTATYINKFHEMEQRMQNLPVIISKPSEPIQKLTYRGIPVITTRILSEFTGMPQSTIVAHAKHYKINYTLLKDAELKEFVRENSLRHYCVSRIIIFTRETTTLLLSRTNSLTEKLKVKLNEYFALVPLAKPMSIVEAPKPIEQPKQVLYADIPNNKKICEQIERVKSFMDALDLLLFQYNRHIKQEHADAYRKVISLVGSELYNEVLDLSIMKYQLVEKPGY